jgi:ubiquinone/menaquinone biosynthesis C-methylase UbiE
MRGSDEVAVFKRFACSYRHTRSEVMVEIDRQVFGCDYGSTSWTTQSEARRIAGMLNLGPDKTVLDVGSGSGWPALFWARTTGCAAVLTDVPVGGLEVAAERAEEDQLSERCWVVAADGRFLPFRDSAFAAISHSDVLCCLPDKMTVLKACRRLIRADGKMVFTVISIAGGLSTGQRQLAVQSGPPFVDTNVEYPEMLRLANWRITDHYDLTLAYGSAVRRLLGQEQIKEHELVQLFGRDDYLERIERHRRAAEAVEAGLLRRDLFSAVPE